MFIVDVRRRRYRWKDRTRCWSREHKGQGGSSAVGRLTVAAYGIHISDQIGLVATPLIAAVVFEASAATLGTLVALQSLPHLIGSLPSGLLVDRFRPEFGALASAALSTIGFVGVAVTVSMKSVEWFAVLILLSGLGVVVFVLAAQSLIPRIVTVSRLAVSNARIEFPRAIAGVAAPLLVGFLVNIGFPGSTFLVAASASALAFWSIVKLIRSGQQASVRSRASGSLERALQMVVRDHLLRPIMATAVFWNLAFAVLIVTAVPYLTDHLAKAPETFGVAMSFFGVGAIAGIWLMRVIGGRIQPRFVLLFGPASSLAAAATLSALPKSTPSTTIILSFFVLGFGPSMWLVTQNTIRQAVTPVHMLGSVNAVIQTGIYGSRPIGAAVGGLILGGVDPRTGIVVVSFLFVGSFVAAALSGLRNVRNYESTKT